MINSCATISADDFESIRIKISALNNPIRWEILQMLRRKEVNSSNNCYIENYSMSVREIGEKLKEKDIITAVQNLGQHLKLLRKAGLVDRTMVNYNDVGLPIPHYLYYLKVDAFDDLFLEVNFFRDELNSYVDLYKESKELKKYHDCVLTVFNGVDKGKRLTIDADERAFIGRRSLSYKDSDNDSVSLELSNSYESVSSINKPHLIVYNKRGTWYMRDESSTNGTYCSHDKLKRGKAKEIPNNSLIKLSKGQGSALLYISYN